MPTTCASATAGGKRYTITATTIDTVAIIAIQAASTASFASMVVGRDAARILSELAVRTAHDPQWLKAFAHTRLLPGF